MAENPVQPKFRYKPLLSPQFSTIISAMSKKGRPYTKKSADDPPVQGGLKYLSAYRIKAGLTQGALGELAGFSKAAISDMEKQKYRYSADGIGRLTNALRISEYALKHVDPADPDVGDLWEIWREATPEQRDLIRGHARLVVPKREK